MVSQVRRKEIAASTFKERAHRLGQTKPGQNVAFFSMEYALRNQVRIYSGGLGVLAGDWVKSAADTGTPLFPIGLLYRDGYFTQTIAGGQQKADQQRWDIEKGTGIIDLQESVTLEIGGQKVVAKVWGMEVPGFGGGFVPVTLLDTRGAANPHGFDEITSRLYASGSWERLTQEMVLGIGGVRALQIYGLPIAYYHLNEGHAAFATVEVLNRRGKAVENLTPDDLRQVEDLFSFTTHTPVKAGFDMFPLDDITRAFSEGFLRQAVLQFGQDPQNQSFVNMAMLAMRLSGVRNGVSLLHAQVSEGMFPDFRPIIGITNGVHHLTWTSEVIQSVFDEFVPEWRKDPTKLSELSSRQNDPLFRDAVWAAHQANKGRLMKMIHKLTGVEMDKDVFTIGFARRFATYKRGDLLFTNEAELLRLAEEHGGLQIVMSGKAHPADVPGRGVIAKVIEAGNRLTHRSGGKVKFTFIPDYDMDKASVLVAGADIWLNTPLRPHEASGTSGMKASFNAVPNISVLDGWWAENRGGGWSVGDPERKPNRFDPYLYQADSASLYQVLGEALSAYKNRAVDPTFITKMIEAVAGNAAYFNTQRMLGDYCEKVWRPRILGSLALPDRVERKALSLTDSFNLLGETTLAISVAPNEAAVEEQVAAAFLKSLGGCRRVTRYDAHNESVRIARSWIGSRFGDGIIRTEEDQSGKGASCFDHWQQLEKFSGEVMADLIREKKMQIVSDPGTDPRCCRDGKPSASGPFILVPEIVDGEVRGAYKLDFSPGYLNLEENGRALIDALLHVVGLAKAERLKAELAVDFAGMKSETAIINWALTLATAGGFVDMPRYAVEANRAAIFIPGEDGELVGRQAIGEVGREEHGRRLGDVSKDLHSEGVRDFLRKLDQGQGSLQQKLQGKKVGSNIVGDVIQVRDGITLFDHTKFDSSFDTAKLRDLMENLGQHLAVDGGSINNYLLLPLIGDGGQPLAMAYVDNAFTGQPLNQVKFMAIFNAAARRLAELRAGSSANS